MYGGSRVSPFLSPLLSPVRQLVRSAEQAYVVILRPAEPLKVSEKRLTTSHCGQRTQLKRLREGWRVSSAAVLVSRRMLNWGIDCLCGPHRTHTFRRSRQVYRRFICEQIMEHCVYVSHVYITVDSIFCAEVGRIVPLSGCKLNKITDQCFSL